MSKADVQARITIVPGLCGGRPTVRGMRVTVANILELLASGMTEQQVLAEYPYLEPDDIRACLDFAARMSSFSIDPLSASAA